MKHTQNQKGFSIVELFIVLIIVIAIGAGGYFVYKHHHKTAPVSSTVSTTSTATTGAVTTTLGKTPQALQTAVTSSLKVGGSCLGDNGQTRQVSGGCGCINASGQVETYDIQTSSTISTGPASSLDVWYENNAGAAVNACDSLNLYSYTNGEWTFIASSQEGFACSLLQQYKFPAAVLNVQANASSTQCFDSSNNNVTYSD